jgi:hypothetical protein
VEVQLKGAFNMALMGTAKGMIVFNIRHEEFIGRKVERSGLNIFPEWSRIKS